MILFIMKEEARDNYVRRVKDLANRNLLNILEVLQVEIVSLIMFYISLENITSFQPKWQSFFFLDSKLAIGGYASDYTVLRTDFLFLSSPNDVGGIT